MTPRSEGWKSIRGVSKFQPSEVDSAQEALERRKALLEHSSRRIHSLFEKYYTEVDVDFEPSTTSFEFGILYLDESTGKRKGKATLKTLILSYMKDGKAYRYNVNGILRGMDGGYENESTILPHPLSALACTYYFLLSHLVAFSLGENALLDEHFNQNSRALLRNFPFYEETEFEEFRSNITKAEFEEYFLQLIPREVRGSIISYVTQILALHRGKERSIRIGDKELHIAKK